MDAQHPIPLPVQPLAYETPQPSPWGKIIKVITTLGLLQGCFAILTTLFSLMNGPSLVRGGPGYLVVVCAQLVFGAAGLAALVTAILMIQRTNATTLMLVSALAMAVTKILLTIVSIVFVAMQMSPRSIGGPQYLTYMGSNLSWGIQGALSPAMLAVLLIVGRNDEGYRRLFMRQ